ncbi:MAG: gliding motility-associated ABC transporter substrate-binding protein GldG [Bacteroidetes bacterium RBG_13_43_22]|nr:MAG: gliding motility-associated ABC transporter substrate-binding protein GldG [Bacteroidetes bacterium RBG_13_43_22]
METRNDSSNIRVKGWMQFIMIVAGIILLASVCSLVRVRIDLTEDKRFTLSPSTKKVLDNIENDIYIEVFLDGEMPIPLKRLKKSVKEMLDEFRIESGRKIAYSFINPAAVKDAEQREAQYLALYNKGLNPVDVVDNLDDEGGKSRKMVFPGLIVNYNGAEVPVNFLRNNQSVSYEQNILHSMESLEYEMIQTIATVTSDTIYKIAFLEGQGEFREIEVADITMNLAKFFTVDRGSVGGQPGILNDYAAVIIAGPASEFSEPDKLVLDQYIMNGGRVLWLLEEVAVSSDSLMFGETVGLYRTLNIEDQLFRYGARINPEIVQDLDCIVIRLSVTTGAEQKQIVPAPWVYYPRLTPNPGHPVTRNLNKVKGEFVNTIDTVGFDPAIRKTVLLSTSGFARTLNPPLLIRLKEAENLPDDKEYNKANLPVAVLLEGKFPSAFKNRMTGNIISDRNFRVKTESSETKMIVVADGDIIRNDISRAAAAETPLPLGQDRYTGEMFGNRDFLINCMNYLVDDNGLMELRSREMKLRLLDKSRIRDQRLIWQIINIAGPVLIVILAGIIYGIFRKRRFTKY